MKTAMFTSLSSRFFIKSESLLLDLKVCSKVALAGSYTHIFFVGSLFFTLQLRVKNAWRGRRMSA